MVREARGSSDFTDALPPHHLLCASAGQAFPAGRPVRDCARMFASSGRAHDRARLRRRVAAPLRLSGPFVAPTASVAACVRARLARPRGGGGERRPAARDGRRAESNRAIHDVARQAGAADARIAAAAAPALVLRRLVPQLRLKGALSAPPALPPPLLHTHVPSASCYGASLPLAVLNERYGALASCS
eukprot:423183-Pleurochrysis_carterae.AAC.1